MAQWPLPSVRWCIQLISVFGNGEFKLKVMCNLFSLFL